MLGETAVPMALTPRPRPRTRAPHRRCRAPEAALCRRRRGINRARTWRRQNAARRRRGLARETGQGAQGPRRKIATGYALVGEGRRMDRGRRDCRWSGCIFSRSLSALAASPMAAQINLVVDRAGRSLPWMQDRSDISAGFGAGLFPTSSQGRRFPDGAEVSMRPRRVWPRLRGLSFAACRPRRGRRGALHAATWKTAAISNVAVAFRRILRIAALVLPIQIVHHWQDIAASTPPLPCADWLAITNAQD
jgi:hypothetical protein